MSEIASAFITIAPSMSGFSNSLNRQVGGSVTKSGRLSGASFGKSFLKSFAAIGIGTAVAGFLKDSVTGYVDHNKVLAITANTIKTTGGAANVTAGQVGKLADAIERQTGVDGDLVQGASNMLLTFTNLKNGVGAGNKIFDQATRIVTDMSVALGTDAKGSAIQVGKALNDPIKGVSALSRVGVSFTDQQKEQIKTLVESGNTMKAQKIILGELGKEFGGAAKAAKSPTADLTTSFHALQDQVGAILLPALTTTAGFLATKVVPGISNFITSLQNGSGSAGRFGTFLRANVLPVLQDLGNFIQNKVLPVYRQGLIVVIDAARSSFAKVRKAISDNKPELQQLLNGAKKLANYFVTKVMPVLYQLAGSALKQFGTAISLVIGALGFAVRANEKYKSALAAVRGAVQTVIEKFTSFASAVRQKVSNAIETVKGLPAKIKGAVGNLGSTLVRAGEQVIEGLIKGIKNKLGALGSTLGGVGGFIKDHKGPPAKDKVMLFPAGQMIMDGLIAGIQSRDGALGNALEKVGKKVKEKIGKVRDQLSSVKSDFAGLVDPIASNFTQGLFDFDNASAFTANLTTVKGTLQTLLGNFKTLIGEGLNPGFLYQLFQSGGPGLINSLAALPKDEAVGANSLFQDVSSLSQQLGTAVAGATDKGAALENQTVRLEKKLDQLIKATDHGSKRIETSMTQPAKRARRRAVLAA